MSRWYDLDPSWPTDGDRDAARYRREYEDTTDTQQPFDELPDDPGPAVED